MSPNFDQTEVHSGHDPDFHRHRQSFHKFNGRGSAGAPSSNNTVPDVFYLSFRVWGAGRGCHLSEVRGA